LDGRSGVEERGERHRRSEPPAGSIVNRVSVDKKL
jgi:hypothetical protein